MRWNNPKVGTLRVRRKFAFLPVKTNLFDGGPTVWLESYYSLEEWYGSRWNVVNNTQDEMRVGKWIADYKIEGN